MPKHKAPKSQAKPAKRASTTLHFATNRPRLSDGFAQDADLLAGAHHPLFLGRAEVGWVGDPIDTEAPRSLLRAPEIIGDDDFADPVGGACARLLDDWLVGAAARGAVPLFYLHGFSNSFSDALQRAAQIEEFYEAEGLALAPLVFSWPSDGRVLDPRLFAADAGLREQYLDDQRDATASAPALARLIREIWRARERAAQGVTPGASRPRLVLLAHSMGNHALACGMEALNNGLLTREMEALFAQAILVAADVAANALEPGQPLRLLPQMAEKVTVCISQDCTLSVASQIANGNRRLGHYGPTMLANLPPAVEVVDCFSGLDWESRDRILAKGGTEWDVVQHQWYRNDLKARAALAALLAGKKPPFKALELAQQLDSDRNRHAILA
ncbi:alpha/beta hydrolase [Roseomonas frigidaquae]|uniref:Alpha/beta hydrolase n=1 Tax=Falsiroseomonas frigidaquae TaxID=487318 RepID=A0ABX1F4L0_9PROT|nr:alpha/beta hydrolase [Falsiroseomonas frigidaquae]NKE47277.1 alpha/beta hydrolase [Falsiroseomonas frigidaquae]